MNALEAHTVFDIAKSLDHANLIKLASMLSSKINNTQIAKPVKKKGVSVAELKQQILATHKPASLKYPVRAEMLKKRK